MSDSANLPALTVSPDEVARLKTTLSVSDRAKLVTFGDSAQRSVSQFTEKVLAQAQNRELGDTGKLLSDILAKARGLDASQLKDAGFLTKLFSSWEARVRRFAERYEDVAGQIDRVVVELDRHKDTLKRDIAVLDDLHEQTKGSIVHLDTYIQAGKEFIDEFRAGPLAALKVDADGKAGTSDGLIAAQAYQDALQALDRLEKRVFYLEQARQIGIQQMPQIRIVQSSDETLIENLQATTQLTIPVWKQKMVVLLGLNRQKAALDLQKTVTDATNDMIRQASAMMKDQAVDIERASQRGIVDIETLEQANRDLIDAVESVLKIQAEGRQKRAEIEQRMEALNLDLKNALSQAPQ